MASGIKRLHTFQKVLIAFLSLLIIYGLGGFFAVPWLVERQLVQTLQQRMNLTTTIESVQVNPFLFKASVNSLQIEEEDNSLLTIEQIFISVSPVQLPLLTLHINEITLKKPELWVHRYQDASTTFSRLAQSWQSTSEADTETVSESDSASFPLEIQHFALIDGRANYYDDNPQGGFETVVGPIDISLENFSKQADTAASTSLTLAFEQDAALQLTGNLALAPLTFEGQLQLDNFALTSAYRYFAEQLPAEVTAGRFSAEMAYLLIANAQEVALDLTAVTMQLDGLTLLDKSESTLVDGGQLSLTNGRFRYPQMQAEAEQIAINDYRLKAALDKQGELSWLQLFPDTAVSDDSRNETAESALVLEIAEILVQNSSIVFEDNMPETPVYWDVSVDAGLQDFVLNSEARQPVQAQLSFASGGAIDMDGELGLQPDFAFNGNVAVNDFDLRPLQTYLSPYAAIAVNQGKFNASADIAINPQQSFAFKGAIELAELDLEDQLMQARLLAFDLLSVNQIDLSLSDKSLSISELVFDALYSRVIIDVQGDTNIAAIFEKASAPDLQIENNATLEENIDNTIETDIQVEPEWHIAVDKIQINNASSQFTDRNLPIIFEANMQELNGQISSFSTASAQATSLSLEGRVDEFGLVEIDGELHPLDLTQATQINLTFSNLDLPAMSPYTVKFAGREIAEGKADLDLRYEINQKALQATNKIVLSEIRLGAKVDSPDALDLPLDLAIALLKDSDGMIDLEIPLSGDMANPEFDFGPIIRQAISNMLGNIVSAPFRFLANLIGGESAELGEVSFRAGRSDLTPPEQEKLIKLGNALSEREALVLSVPAPFVADVDSAVLQQRQVEQRLEDQLDTAESSQSDSARRLQLLENFYIAAELTPDLTVLRQQFQQQQDESDTDAAQSDATPVLDETAYSAAIKDRLIAAETITETQLTTLALDRQKAIIDFVADNAALASERFDKQLPEEAKSESGRVVTVFDVDVSQIE